MASCVATSCKKDTPGLENEEEKPVPEQVISELTGKLASADSISNFVAALENLQLSAAEVSEGITVFAPLNETEAQASAPQTGRPVTKSAGVPLKAGESPVLKDHVVKGVYTVADLTDGKILTTLSGKQLKVKRTENRVWLNGVELSGEGIVTEGGHTVFVVKRSLTGTEPNDEPEPGPEITSLTVVVWDAGGWTPSQPDGVPAEGAEVALYKSREDFAAANPAYVAQAGEDGNAVFDEIEPGTYYVHAQLDHKSNIILKSKVTEDGVYTGLAIEGIYASENETPAGQLPGNFRFVDVNADGQINGMDRLPVPYESAEVSDGSALELNVYIGYINNAAYGPLDQAVAQDLLDQVSGMIGNWYQLNVVMLDALLSDDAEQLPAMFGSQFQGVDDFSFSTTHPAFANVWRNGFEPIYRLNRIIWEIENGSLNDQALLGQAKGLRAFVYLVLVNYFGEVPYADGIVSEEGNYDFGADRESLLNFISADLDAALSRVPAQGDPARLTAGAVKALQAKVALAKKNHALVAQITGDIIQGAQYQLETGTAIFEADSKEFIWHPRQEITGGFQEFFFGRARFPYLRITEIYLMRVEALINEGAYTDAWEILALLNNRKGTAPPPQNGSLEELRARLWSLWKSEMPREGSRFLNLVRWDQAMDVLAPKGYLSFHGLLPIPQYVIDSYPLVNQNPGY